MEPTSPFTADQTIAFYTMDTIVGSTLVDETGNHDGTMHGNPGQVAGYVDSALLFDGSDDWVGIDSLKSYPVTGDDLTMSCWFRTTAAKSGDHNNIIFSANRSNKDNVFRLGTGNTGGIFHSSHTGDNEYGSGWNDGAWHLLVCIQYGTGQFMIYVDNTLIQSGTKSPTPWSDAAYYSIGQEWDGTPSDFFTGRIDQLRIDNYALSPAEIAALYVDMTPPELAGTDPIHGSSSTEVDQIQITLLDRHGSVDDAAVIASVEVLDSGSNVIDGSTVEANDTFTFTPSLPLDDDLYTVSLTAVDMEGNSAPYTFSFTKDGSPPASPAITGGTVTSGLIQARPVQNSSNTTNITLTGTREDATSVWVNGVRRKILGSGNWSFNLTLIQGANALEIWVEDAAENKSDSVWVDIQVDSIAPKFTSVTPADNSLLNAPPATIVVGYQEATSGLNLENSTLLVKDSTFTDVEGSWALSGDDQIQFTPDADFHESEYTIQIKLQDNLGNLGNLRISHFTVDTTPPIDPVIQATSPAHNATQEITVYKRGRPSIIK